MLIEAQGQSYNVTMKGFHGHILKPTGKSRGQFRRVGVTYTQPTAARFQDFLEYCRDSEHIGEDLAKVRRLERVHN